MSSKSTTNLRKSGEVKILIAQRNPTRIWWHIERLINIAYQQAPKDFINQFGVHTYIDEVRDIDM